MSRPRLTRLLQPGQRHLRQVDDRRAVEVFDGRLEGRVLEDVGHHAQLDALLRGGVGHLDHAPVGVERQRQDHLVDAVLGDHPGDLVQVAQHRDVEVAAVALGRVVVEKADHLEAELAVVEDLAGDLAAQIAGADHRMRIRFWPLSREARSRLRMVARAAITSSRSSAANRPRKAAAVGDDPRQGVAGGDVGRLDQDDGRGQQHRGQDDRHHHGERLVHPVAAAADLIEAVEVDDQRPEADDDRQQDQVAPELRLVPGGPTAAAEAEVPGGEEGADVVTRSLAR